MAKTNATLLLCYNAPCLMHDVMVMTLFFSLPFWRGWRVGPRGQQLDPK